jgi:hypothetical protein
MLRLSSIFVCAVRSGKGEVAPKTRKGYRGVWIDSTTVQMLMERLGGRTAGGIFQSRVGHSP